MAATSCARYMNSASLHPNKKHPKAFAQYLPSTLIALKVLHDLHEIQARPDRPRRDLAVFNSFISNFENIRFFHTTLTFFQLSAEIYFKL